MKNIDFLPASYREALQQKQNRVWWGVIATAFGLGILATALAQWGIAKSLEYQLATAGTAALSANEQDKRYAQLLAEVNRGSELASLYVYLKHPWPRTQVLAALVSPLPEAVRLTDVRIRQEAPAGTNRVPFGARPADGKAEPTKAGPAADLARLREENDHLITLVEVIGETSDADALHQYVSALGRSDLLLGARLKSFEAVEAKESGIVRFEIRAQVRPGYGLSGGPDGPPAVAAPADQSPQQLPATHEGEGSTI